MTATRPTSRPNPFIRLPRRVVIAGGDATAWMAAALLNHCFRRLECLITVVPGTPEPAAPTAESTWPSFVGLLENLGSDENDMMRHCRATFKLATQFSDWAHVERDFWQPFPSDQPRIAGCDLFQTWFSERSQGRLLRPFTSYSLHWAAALAGKSPHSFSGTSPLSASGQYGFHADACGLADWLRQSALAAGVEEVAGEMESISPNGRGGIAQLKLSNGKAVPGEFFIDATGSNGRLIASVTDDAFESWGDQLPCDRIVSVRLPGSRQVAPYTRVTGLDCGWSWQIPLAGAVDHGYVFSSAFVSDADAWQQLRSALPQSQAAQVNTPASAEPQFHALASGRRPRVWHDNVLALGQAACRLEPLAATGLHFSQAGLELFMELFPDRSGNDARREEYNRRMASIADDLRDFVQLHYLLSQRRDTPFWQAATTTTSSAALQQRLALYDESGTLGDLAIEAVPAIGYQYLLTGCGRLPRHASIIAGACDPVRVQQELREILQRNESVLKELPLHEDLLDWIHADQNVANRIA